MDRRQHEKHEQFRFIHEWLGGVALDPMPALFLKKRDELGASAAHIAELARQQLLAREATSGRVRTRIDTIRRTRMQPLARIARPLLRYAPGAEEALRVPHKRERAAVVAAQAVKMAEFLETHVELLAEASISREYLDEFRAEAHALASATANTRTARQRLSSATRDLVAEVSKADAAVQVIYGLMGVHLGDRHNDVSSLRLFMKRQKRVGRPPKKRARRRPTDASPRHAD